MLIKDPTEQLVSGYLGNQGLEFIHHPDGVNDPPDFSVNGRIGIEVRGLNQHVVTPEGPRGLEQDAIPLNSLIGKTLATTGSPGDGPCWLVYDHFRRPGQPAKNLVQELHKVLHEVQSASDGSLDERWIGNLRLRFYKSSVPLEHTFELGGCSDSDSGGFVVSEMQRNLQFCLDEKTRKIVRVQSRYAEW